MVVVFNSGGLVKKSWFVNKLLGAAIAHKGLFKATSIELFARVELFVRGLGSAFENIVGLSDLIAVVY
jgi:hypothetical protein